MVAPNLKAETMCLIEKREAIETEMNAIISTLTQAGGPGLTGNLLDFEGFPRSDIDVHAVRAQRHHLAELRNDHKDITNKIEESLQVLHSARLARNISAPAKSPDAQSSMDVDLAVGVPFAMVDEITDVSPSAEDGLQLGDQIMKFGNVEFGDNLLQKLASEVQSNQDRAVPLVILRHGAPINLAVTPRQWNGRGLLGCHFRIL